MTVTRKPPPDWEVIHREYRAGQLSIAAIARRYAISRAAVQKRAARENWSRDLTDDVRAETAARVQQRLAGRGAGHGQSSQGLRVAGQVAGAASRARDEDIVEAFAVRGAELVFGHADEIQRLRAIADQLERLLAGHLGIADAPAAVQIGTGEDARSLTLGGVVLGKGDSLAILLRTLAEARERIIRLERQAFALDDSRGVTSAPPMILDTDQK
jgi:hypothetical protein